MNLSLIACKTKVFTLFQDQPQELDSHIFHKTFLLCCFEDLVPSPSVSAAAGNLLARDVSRSRSIDPACRAADRLSRLLDGELVLQRERDHERAPKFVEGLCLFSSKACSCQEIVIVPL